MPDKEFSIPLIRDSFSEEDEDPYKTKQNGGSQLLSQDTKVLQEKGTCFYIISVAVPLIVLIIAIVVLVCFIVMPLLRGLYQNDEKRFSSHHIPFILIPHNGSLLHGQP